MLKLSIIIPVYNVEPYLAKCLDSVINQDISLNEFEVIVVNDGSPDGSLAIAEEYARNYTNIKVITRTNGGLSAARNTGLEHAQGEYVWFVDSDDWIEKNSLKTILDGCVDYPDMVGIQYRLIYDDSKKNRNICASVVDGIQNGRYVLKYGNIAIPVQFCIYNLQFLRKNNLFFAEGKIHEDSEFKPRAIYLADKIKTIDYICYNYYQGNSNSITAKHTYRNVDGYMYAAESLNLFCINKVKKGYRKYLYREVGRCVNGAIFSFVNLNDKKECICSRERILKTKSVFYSMLKTYSLSYVFEGLFLLIAPSLFLTLYPKLKKIK